MTPSANCYALIKQFEGLRLTAYRDSVGVWTIGYGSTRDIHEGMVISQEQADAKLVADVGGAAHCVNTAVKSVLTQNQFDALVSFVFNVGCEAFTSSTMLRDVNAENFLAAGNGFLRWIHAGNAVLPGLVQRRLAEKKVFQT